MINILLAEHDLSKLSRDQREFLVQRIDHLLDTDPEIREIIAKKLHGAVQLVSPNAKLSAK